jgi:MFS family permease
VGNVHVRTASQTYTDFVCLPYRWTLGAIFGPTLGGALSNPLHVDPRKPRGDRFFERFPYSPPNIAAASFFAIGIIIGWLFLEETLERKRHHQDLGLRTGAKIMAFLRKTSRLSRSSKDQRAEREPLLSRRKVYDEAEHPLGITSEVVEESPRIRDVLTYQTTLNLVVYALLALYTLAYDQV